MLPAFPEEGSKDREFQIRTEVHQTRERRAVDDIADRRSDTGPDESRQAENLKIVGEIGRRLCKSTHPLQCCEKQHDK